MAKKSDQVSPARRWSFLTAHLLDQVIDIASSGSGGELGSWHKEELTTVFKKLTTAQEREEFFVNEFLPYTQTCDGGWYLSDMKLIKQLLKIKKPITIEI
jgi:hypothetical protein